MADAPAAPATVATPATAANDNATPATPATPNPVSQAAKTLASAREARRAALRQGADKDPKTATPSSPPSDSTETSTDTPKPAAEPEADEIAALIREDRRVKGAAKQLEARAAEVEARAQRIEPWLPRIETAEAAFAKGDVVSGVKALLPNPDLANDLFWELAKSIGEDPGEAPPVDIRKVVEEEILARQKAEREEAEQRRKQEREAVETNLNGARGEFLGACNDIFQGKHAQFPEIVRVFRKLGPDATPAINRRLIDKVESHYRTTREMLSAAQALQLVEQELLSIDPPAQVEPPRPSPTVTSSWRSDPGRPAPAEGTRRSVDQMRAEIKARLRAG